jgi:hypothetical protein
VRVEVVTVRKPVEDERVEDEVRLVEDVDFEGATTALHVPNLDWQPAEQYALVLPHLDEGQCTNRMRRGAETYQPYCEQQLPNASCLLALNSHRMKVRRTRSQTGILLAPTAGGIP